MKSNKIIIMYHNIESKKIPAVIGSFPISIKKFKNDIKLLKKYGYKFDFISNIHKASKEKLAYITGDDGTIDWTRNILPWCEEQKIPTHTGVITGIFEEKPIYPLTHLVQVILVLRDKNNLIELSNRLKKDYLTIYQQEYINKIYYYEDMEYRRVIKGAFNLILETHLAYELLGKLSDKEKENLQNRFENLEYYKKFKYAQIGVHTRTHCALGEDKDSYIKNEIISCVDFFKKNKIDYTNYFVSPMKPKFGASLNEIKDDLHKIGFDGILDSNHGIWDQNDFVIPRIDTIYLSKIIL